MAAIAAITPRSLFPSPMSVFRMSLLSASVTIPSFPSLISFPVGHRLAPIARSASRILQDIWGSILKAVPKKKTTYSKKRSRFLAGKGLQDENAFMKCPSCGQPKRLHLLCPYCVEMVRHYWKQSSKQA